MLTEWIAANNTMFIVSLLVIALWDIIWKGTAMWKASKRGSNVWFWVLLIFNTAGILPILYHLFTKKKAKPTQQVSQPAQ